MRITFDEAHQVVEQQFRRIDVSLVFANRVGVQKQRNRWHAAGSAIPFQECCVTSRDRTAIPQATPAEVGVAQNRLSILVDRSL